MGDCDFVSKNIEAFVDSELSSTVRNKVEDHLNNCPHCRGRRRHIVAAKGIVSKTIKRKHAPIRLTLSLTSMTIAAQYRQPAAEEDPPLVPLGFCDDFVPPGTHICLFYEEEKERDQILFEYINAGIRNRERCYCSIDSPKPLNWIKRLYDRGYDIEPALDRGELHIFESSTTYLPKGKFVPDDIINGLINITRESVKAGYPNQRVFGELNWTEKWPHLGDRFIEYEQKVDARYFPNYPGIAICVYNLRVFDDKFIEQILNHHPYYIFKGDFKRNPSYA